MFTPSSQRVSSLRRLVRVAIISLVATTSVAACGGSASNPADTIALVKGANGLPKMSNEFAKKVSDAVLKKARTKLSDSTIGNGLVAVSDIVINDENDGVRSGGATLTFKQSELVLAASFEVTDEDNWQVSVDKTSSSRKSKYAPANMPDFTIDRSQISGTIGKTDGKMVWNLVGPSVNWVWNKNITMSATIGISNKCPFNDDAKCPSGNNVFVTMPTMSLGVDSLGVSVQAVGAFSISQSWMRIEATTGDVNLPQGSSIKNTEMVMWVGDRKDSFDENLQLPDLGSLNKGLNAEFCGDFSLEIPKIVNKSTSGCARWSTAGFVIGQLGVGSDLSTSYSSPDLNVSGSSVTKVAGAAFNSLSANVLKSLPNPTVAFNGAVAKLANMSISVGGTTQGIPGKLLQSLGKGEAAIKAMQSVPLQVGGVISAHSVDLTASAPVSGKIGKDPMTLDLKTLQMNLAASTDGDASLTVSLVADTTFGYGTTSAPFETTISLTAQVGTDTGIGFVVNAHGVPSSLDASRTGNSNADKLSDPQHATWVWKNAFDIPGYNLWNMTTQIGFFGGSPQFAYNATGYLDPTNPAMDKMVNCGSSKSKSTVVGEKCVGADWLMSQLVTSMSVTEPCFAWSFDGGATGTTLSISQGAMRTQKFKIGFAPAGCTVGTGDDQVVLPPAFAGFQFETQIGDATASFIFRTSTDGFLSVVDLENVNLGPINYKTLNLTTEIKKDGSSDTSFVADMDFKSGSFYASGELSANSKGMYQHVIGVMDVGSSSDSGDAAKKQGSWSLQDNSDGGGQRFSVQRLYFEESIQADSSGSKTRIDLSGKITVRNNSYDLVSSYMRAKDGLIDALHFEMNVNHAAGSTTRTARMKIDYKVQNGAASFFGRFDLNYSRRYSKTVASYEYERHLDINVYMQMDLKLAAPGEQNSSAKFKFGGSFDADDISGGMGCSVELDTDPDFHCRGEVTFHKKGMKHYHVTWDF